MKRFTIYKFFLAALLCGAAAWQTAEAQQNANSLVCLRTADAVTQDVQLHDWLYRLQPTMFINEHSVAVHPVGEAASVLECVPSQTEKLYQDKGGFEQVKVIKIKLQTADAVLSLDLERLRAFPNLHYVWVVYEYDACGDAAEDCLPNLLEQGITHGEAAPDVKVLYELNNG